MTTLLIWDSVDEPNNNNINYNIVYWKQVKLKDKKNFEISICEFIQENRNYLRKKYLNWIYLLSNNNNSGDTIIEKLVLKNGLSYWWLTSLGQKFNISKTSNINNSIKLLALEKIIDNIKPAVIKIETDNDILIKSLYDFCKTKKIILISKRVKNTSKFELIYIINEFFLSLVYLVWYTLKNTPKLNFKNNSVNFISSILFIDIFTHLNKKSITEKRFLSNYWTEITNILKNSEIVTNWLHIYYRDSMFTNISKAKKLILKFNSNKKELQYHELLENFFSIKIIYLAIKNYICLFRAFLNTPSYSHIKAPDSSIDLWELHTKEWMKSLIGVEAIRNCIRISLIDYVFKNIPKQKLGIYIYENQPWEMALIHSWKSSGHGSLVGFQHSIIRFWDLRYFQDERFYDSKNFYRVPQPDLLGVNNDYAFNEMISSGYPSKNIIKLEALRYQYLNNIKINNYYKKNEYIEKCILFCGDFNCNTNLRILDWFKKIKNRIPKEYRCIFKPHPAFPVDKKILIDSKIEISNDPLAILFGFSDIVISSCISTSAVEAYSCGKFVVQIPDENSLIYNSLCDEINQITVYSAESLLEAILSHKLINNNKNKEYFYLNKNLDYWREFLEHYNR